MNSTNWRSHAGIRVAPLASLLLAACFFSQKQVAENAHERAWLTGTIRDSLTPVQGVTVTLHHGSSVLAKAVTDNTGQFSLGSQPEGYHELLIVSSAYADCRFSIGLWIRDEFLIGVTPARDSGKVREQATSSRSVCSCRSRERRPTNPDASPLAPPSTGKATVAVDVVDAEEGIPLHTASVVLYPDEAPAGILSAHSNKMGRAVFPNVPPGKYRVLTRRVGSLPARSEIIVIAEGIHVLPVRLPWPFEPYGCLSVVTS